ncbi:MAG: hypothetical protein COV46_08375 [Deltaproteobacteria bacterium CG11_big_fil_rev_8_21_14_0_20_49_13]|nr:MAG: hypothetical protein COV46_08375 [Deltaproteobacteria bacterium CG11_big_fil_rev_8_21_14_0_20_49_13]
MFSKYFMLPASCFLLPVSCLLLLSSCERCSPGSSTASVIVERVKIQESSPEVTVPGILIPRDNVEVKMSRTARLADVFANKGDLIKEGAVLARLSEEDVNLKLNRLRAAKKEAETAVEKNQYLMKNRDRMLEEGKIDKTQYDGMAIEAASAESTFGRINADLDDAEYNAAHLQVTSPISGVITEKYASPMQTASEDQVLFVVVNIDPILVSFPLTADESTGISLGMPINVKVEDVERAYKGRISYTAPMVNQPGMTFDVWASIPNPEGVLKTGMSATAQFTSTNIHKVIVVPRSALISRDRDRFIFTVSNGIAHKTKVSVRNMTANIAEISKGLAENDLIVVKGVQNLQDGSPVEMWRR